MNDTEKILNRLTFGIFYEWNLVDIKDKCESMIKNKEFSNFPNSIKEVQGDKQ